MNGLSRRTGRALDSSSDAHLEQSIGDILTTPLNTRPMRRSYIDRPLTANLAKDLVESVNALLRREVRAGRLVGGEAYLANGNTADQLAAGKLRIGYRFTPCAPLEDLGVEVVITDEFYGNTFDLAAAA